VCAREDRKRERDRKRDKERHRDGDMQTELGLLLSGKLR